MLSPQELPGGMGWIAIVAAPGGVPFSSGRRSRTALPSNCGRTQFERQALAWSSATPEPVTIEVSSARTSR